MKRTSQYIRLLQVLRLCLQLKYERFIVQPMECQSYIKCDVNVLVGIWREIKIRNLYNMFGKSSNWI